VNACPVDSMSASMFRPSGGNIRRFSWSTSTFKNDYVTVILYDHNLNLTFLEKSDENFGHLSVLSVNLCSRSPFSFPCCRCKEKPKARMGGLTINPYICRKSNILTKGSHRDIYRKTMKTYLAVGSGSSEAIPFLEGKSLV